MCKAVRLHGKVDLIYSPKREDNGNAHSKENPSFVAGAAGGCGSAGPEPGDGARSGAATLSRDRSQARSAPEFSTRAALPGHLISSVASPAPAIIAPLSVLWDRLRHGKTVTKSCQSAGRHCSSLQ